MAEEEEGGAALGWQARTAKQKANNSACKITAPAKVNIAAVVVVPAVLLFSRGS